jgi:hypothetical protein
MLGQLNGVRDRTQTRFLLVIIVDTPFVIVILERIHNILITTAVLQAEAEANILALPSAPDTILSPPV